MMACVFKNKWFLTCSETSMLLQHVEASNIRVGGFRHMKKISVLLICIVVFAAFAIAVEARSLQNKAREKAQLSSNYNFDKEKSMARVEASKTYREKINLIRLGNIEKSNQQYAQKRESKVAQNKALRMQKI